MSTMTVLDRWTYISRCRFGALGVAVGFPLADPIVGILISIVILFVLKGAVTAIYHCMMDAVDPSLVDRVETIATNCAPRPRLCPMASSVSPTHIR
jgi:divalent metal cation (Fe/Co/Zn/Cd) transporter